MILRLVLDSTAVTAYARSSEHVGELLTELADETAELADAESIVGFAVPMTSLAIAAGQLGDASMVNVLMRHPLIAIPDADVSQWVDVAGQLGDAETAAVAIVAMTSDAYVVTQDAHRYATQLLDGLNVIELAG